MSPRGVSAESRAVFAAGGEVGRDLLAVDWAATPLGPVDGWPRSLATVVRVVLTSRFAMWMAWGPELVFFCNDAYRRDTLGKKYPWALGRSAREVWAEIWPEIGPRIETVLRTGEATWDEALQLFLERSGYLEETYHTFSYSPLPDDDGYVAGMLCVVSEDTERVIGERRMATLRDLGAVPAATREEGDFLRAAARQLGANQRSLPFTLVYLLDEEGEARLAGSSGIAAGHLAAPPVIGADALEPWPLAGMREGGAVVVDGIDERFPGLPTGAWELPPQQALVVPLPQPGRRRPFGFLVAAINRFRPLDDDCRAFVALIAGRLAAGIAAARSYETERRRASELEELDRAKTEFFSNVSHEFRTPLTLMLAPLQDALSAPGGLAPGEVELVHRNALRLLKLVNALLDFSRAEAGRMRAEFRPVDAGRLTSELAGTFRDAAARAGIGLVVRCEPLPEQPYIDPDLWERIVLNLLSNAFKVTLEGEITVHLRAHEGRLELSVADTGPGIAPHELGRLFQRFHRVRSTLARSYEGTGIGLALVKELTELHGGRVSATSTLGEGSCFVVTLPFGREHFPAEQVSEAGETSTNTLAALFVEEAMSWLAEAAGEAPPPGRLARTSGGHVDSVLVADDNADVRGYLTRLLSPYFEVETVPDGRAALEVALSRPPDLLISDVMMPELDGLGLLAALREHPQTRELPVIMLSARAGEEAAIEGLEAGADDYLPKPFTGRELLARVRAHLELASVRRAASAEVRAERRQLEQTLQQLPAGVILAAPDGRIMLANEHVADTLGGPAGAADRIADYSERAFTLGGDPLAPERWPLARAIQGDEIVQEEDMLYRAPSGRMLTIRASAAPIRDEQGQTFAGVGVFQDVTDRVRAARLLAGQRDILALIAAGEPLPRTLGAIVECVEALSGFSARGAIMLRSHDGLRLEHGAGPSLPHAFNEAIDGIGVDGDPEWSDVRAIAEPHGLRACWSTTIEAADGEPVGAFLIYYDEPRPPEQADRRLVELLAQTAAVAIGRARDARARARQLTDLQSSLLPRALPEVPGIRAAVRFHPGDPALDVGGDFYDLFPLAGGAWGVLIGDVCGHGAEAAAVTALTRHTTRAMARLESSPARVLSAVDVGLGESDSGRFCTAVFGRLVPGDGVTRVLLACGGHPPPLVRRASGAVEPVEARGPLLGVFSDAVFEERALELAPGDALLLYTDGLVEKNPDIDGEAGLRALLGRLPAETPEQLLQGLERHVVGPPARRRPDDVALLALLSGAR